MARDDNPTITNDLVFGHVMKDERNCLPLIQSILPELGIQKVDVEIQKVLDEHLHERSVRLDVWAEDERKRKYDIECQTTSEPDFEKRVVFYETRLFGNMLERGDKFWNLKDVYVIFFCTFDPFKKGATKYEFKTIDTKNGVELSVCRHEIFFNCSAATIDPSLTENLQAFIKYFNHHLDRTNKYVKRLDRNVKGYITSKEWRKDKMDMQMALDMQELKTLLRDAKGTIKVLRKSSINDDDQLLGLLEENYPDLNEDQLTKLIKETK